MSHEKHKENSPCGRGLRPRGQAGQGQGGGRASPGRGLDTPRWAFWYFPLSSALIKASGQKPCLLKPLMVEETDRERDFLSEGGGGLQGVRAGPCQASHPAWRTEHSCHQHSCLTLEGKALFSGMKAL